ncbi:carbon-nitrogen hydrolase family protein [Embleya hyalina]|uniref:Carbon-nitrogen hydrolase family protein/ nitrilase/cyanide hydratase n=1 Tax=Embleya hyalina TaxID=516124 RepID=A0A401YT46_9ACTN|nr:carbon-nitrogen hydrolase family protein [Embleya hyalina]GCD97764.1 carbon-nitrogen hydrolase family protein/ nitrilase/cyanide hydratase [Embleya hyalina]
MIDRDAGAQRRAGDGLWVTILQSPGSPGDPESNLVELRRAAERARHRGLDVLVTPEMFVTGYDIDRPLADLARSDLLDPVRRIARTCRVAIVVCLPEIASSGAPRMYNTAYFVDSHGEVRGRHRKSHLFGDLDRRLFEPGDRPFTMVDYHGVRIALMICYDVEFPENVRAAAIAGAHLVAVPTAQMEPFAFVADHLIRARAWENQIYVAYANHSGKERATTYVGGSSVVGPSGEVLARIEAETGMADAWIDTTAVAAAQRANPYLRDRRPGLYRALVDPIHAASPEG